MQRNGKRAIHNSVKITLVFLALVLGATCASAGPIVSVSGSNDGSLGLFPFQWEAFSFTVGQSYSNVEISVDLKGSFTGTAYLTTQIGAGTTVANEIASGSFTSSSGPSGALQTVLQNITLTAGTYYLVLSTSDNTALQGVVYTGSPTIVTDPGASNGLFYTVASPPAPSLPAYAPAAGFQNFANLLPGYVGQFEVGLGPATGIPEPTTMALFGVGGIFALVLKRRKRV